MSATVFRQVNYSVSGLIQDIEMGEIGLPEIQRPFVWKNVKVRDLFDSMYRGFPVGYLLFWVNGAPNHYRQIGVEAKQKVPHLLIVDGQQRLTSLYAVLKGTPVLRRSGKQEHIRIAFRPRDATFEVADAATRRDPEFIPDISRVWAKDGGQFQFVKDFVSTLRAGRPVGEEEVGRLAAAIDRLYDLRNYPLIALEVSAAVDEEEVAEVFVRINSKGTPLKQADFILTLMSVFWDEGRAELEKFCEAAREPSAGAPSPFNYFMQPDPDQLLRVSVPLGFRRARLRHVYSILRGKDLETEEFSGERRVAQFERLAEAQEYVLDLEHWHGFFKAVVRAGHRSASTISSQVGLLYAYAVYLIGKRDYDTDEFALRNAMARWFFMTQLTGRYSAAPETTMEQDLARLRGVADAEAFVAMLDGVIRDTLTEDYWHITLPNELASSSARSPAFFAYCAALNLLDARVLFSKLKVAELLQPGVHAKRAAVERHHLFPKAHLATLGITSTRDTNQIANYALLEWGDNDWASGSAPSKYLPWFVARLGAEELAQMCYWHALPEGWEEMEYGDFLAARRKLMASVIRDGFARLSH